MKTDFWKKLFRYGAYWNWFFAASGIIFPKLTRTIMGIGDGGGVGLFQAGFFWAVALFGLMYWWVSLDPSGPASKKLVQLGILGKVMVFAYFAHYFFTGRINFVPFAAGVGDFIFAGFFTVFLVTNGEK